MSAGLSLPRRRTSYGHGRVWVEALRELAKLVDLSLVEPRYLPNGLHRRKRTDVWLVNGGATPPEVRGPAVVVLHEVSWHRPELREQILPAWANAHADAAAACMRLATRVLCPSEAIRSEVLATYPIAPERIDAVAYGVDFRKFRAGRQEGRAIVAKAGGREPGPYVLFVGSLLPRKNLAGLKEAMGGLVEEGFPHVLVVVGAGSPDRSDTSELDRSAGAELPGAPGHLVRIPAPISQRRLAALMAGADAFCVPSLYEGFGLVALEAMACGAPVVVSNGGSLPEVVGEAGVIVEPSAEGIKAGLDRVLRDPLGARRLSAAGRNRAQAMSWQRTAAGWAASLRHAAEG